MFLSFFKQRTRQQCIYTSILPVIYISYKKNNIGTFLFAPFLNLNFTVTVILLYIFLFFVRLVVYIQIK